MKRFFALLLVFSGLGSCGLESEYYSTTYHPQSPEVRVERPENRHYHRGAPRVERNEPGNHQHHGRNTSNNHGHDEQNYN